MYVESQSNKVNYSNKMDNKVVLRTDYSAPECKIREIPMSYSFLQSIGDWKEDPEELN